MRRALVLTAVALLAAVTFSSCAATEAPAATVDGTTISQDDLDAKMAELEEQPVLANLIGLQCGDAESCSTAITGTIDQSFSMRATTSVLDTMVKVEILEQEAERLGVDVVQDDIDFVKQNAAGELPASPDGSVPDVDGEFMELQARFLALLVNLAAKRAEEEQGKAAIDQLIAENSDEFEQVCLVFAYMNDPEQAAAVQRALAAGQSAASISGPVQQQGGNVQPGCLNTSSRQQNLPPETNAALEALQPGQTSGVVPLEVQNTTVYTVVRREDDEAVTGVLRSAILNGLLQLNPQQALLPLFARADVDVSSRYGRWVVDREVGASVVAPTAPTETGEEETRPPPTTLPQQTVPDGFQLPQESGGGAPTPEAPSGGAPTPTP